MTEPTTLHGCVYQGIKQYAGTQDAMYKTIELLCCFPLAGDLSTICSDHMNIHDAFQIIPDSMDALSGLKTNLKNFDFLALFMNASVLALDSLTIIAVGCSAKLLDFAKIAEGIGKAQIFGAAPLAFVAKIALCPAIRVVYIVVLTTSSLIEIRKYRQALEPTNELSQTLKNDQNKREAVMKIARNVTKIGLQVLLFTPVANRVILAAVGVIAALTGMAEGVMKTDAMRHYWNKGYNAEPTYVPRTA